MRIFFLGDLHLKLSNSWDREVIRYFLIWFMKQQFEPGSTLIQLGDVFDKAANYGETIKLATDFFKLASEKFNQVFVLGGNHDLSISKGIWQYATKYLSSSFSNIQTIFDEEVTDLDGTKIAFLPFQKINGKILEKYYSDDLPDEFYKADIICGHVAIKEKGTFFGGINPDKFNKNFAMGHIHTRNGMWRDSYTGSVFPNKINEAETELPRQIMEWNTTRKLWEAGITIPEFVKFEKASLGDKLAYDKDYNNGIHLYTIKNCKHLHEARALYPDSFIYGVEKPKSNDSVTTVSSSNILMSPEEALNMMIKENKLVLKRKTLQVVKELIGV